MSCSLSGAPSGACSDFARAVRTVHCSLFILQSTVGAAAVAPAGTSDSPVNYSGEWLPETRRWQVRVDPPGAPDQGSLRLLGSFLFEPFLLTLYWFVVNLWHL
jgi:hypothetical protein